MNKTEQIIYEIAKKFISPATVYGISSSDVGLMVRAISALFDDMYEGEFVEWAILHKDLYVKFGTLDKFKKEWLDNIKK